MWHRELLKQVCSGTRMFSEDSRIFCEKLCSNSGLWSGMIGSEKRNQGKTIHVEWRRVEKGSQRHRSQREDDTSKMAPEEDVPEGSSWGCLLTLLSKSSPHCLSGGGGGPHSGHALSMRAIPQTAVPLVSSPHRKASVFTANYCRRCIWVLLDSRFLAQIPFA